MTNSQALKELRLKLGLTQRQCAGLLEMTEGNFIKMEHGLIDLKDRYFNGIKPTLEKFIKESKE